MPKKGSSAAGSEQLHEIAESLQRVVGDARDERIQNIKIHERGFFNSLKTAGLLAKQVEGVQWLSASFDLGCSSIMGDEMGMGKTVQTIATLMRLRKMGVRGPFMLVVPPAVLLNWKSEFETWADKFNLPRFHVLICHSSEAPKIPNPEALEPFAFELLGHNKTIRPTKAARLSVMQNFVRLVCAPSEKIGVKIKGVEIDVEYDSAVLITTYDTMVIDRLELEALPRMFPATMRQLWRVVIMDEAHYARNTKTMVNNAAANLAPETYILLSGTIIHNDLHNELQTLLSFVVPPCLKNIDFMDGIKKFKDNALLWDEYDQPVQELQDASKILYAFMIRRLMADNTKEYDMPMCRDVMVSLWGTYVQMKFYDCLHNGLQPRDKNEKIVKRQAKPNYPAIVMQGYEQQVDRHPLIVSSSVVSQIKSSCYHNAMSVPPDGAFLRACAESSQKIVFLLAVLKELHTAASEDHRVLVFSQSTKTIALIGMVLRIAGYSFSTITGETTSMHERSERVKHFNRPIVAHDAPFSSNEDDDDEFETILNYRASSSSTTHASVMLLSTMAMGTGVNIVGADTVIFYDNHVNPQNDAQALARAYRKKQTRPVLVMRLTTAESREYEFMMNNVQHKRRMQHWIEHASISGDGQAGVRQQAQPLASRAQLAGLLRQRGDWKQSTADEVFEWCNLAPTINKWPNDALPNQCFHVDDVDVDVDVDVDDAMTP